jgi:hypothetical protein
VQYECGIPWIVYQQDAWVTANQYQSANHEDMIHLWRLTNERIISVLNGMNEEHYHKLVNTGKEGVQQDSIFTLAEGYVQHLKHHLYQIVPPNSNEVGL